MAPTRPRVANPAAAPAPAARSAALQGTVVQPDDPEPADIARAVCGPDLDAVRAGGTLRFRRGGDYRRRRDRRPGRAVGAAAEGHVPLRRRVRQPGGLP